MKLLPFHLKRKQKNEEWQLPFFIFFGLHPSYSVSFGYAEAIPYSTYSTSPFRYSPSGWYILIGWSAG